MDLLNAISIIVLTATLGVVAWQTDQTRRQAKASERTVEELRKQRMADDEPWLVIDIIDQKLAAYHEWDEQNNTLRHKATGDEVTHWPLPECRVRLHNAGRRAAINAEYSYLQPDTYYTHGPLSVLLHGETREVEVSGFPAPYGTHPEWQKQLLGHLKVQAPGCVIVRYEDVHRRAWVSYQHLEWDDAGPRVWPLKQGRLELE